MTNFQKLTGFDLPKVTPVVSCNYEKSSPSFSGVQVWMMNYMVIPLKGHVQPIRGSSFASKAQRQMGVAERIQKEPEDLNSGSSLVTTLGVPWVIHFTPVSLHFFLRTEMLFAYLTGLSRIFFFFTTTF